MLMVRLMVLGPMIAQKLKMCEPAGVAGSVRVREDALARRGGCPLAVLVSAAILPSERVLIRRAPIRRRSA